MKPALRTGIYRHYKGPHYEVLDLVRHSETEEWLVLYRTCYGERGLWVRPYTMFTEWVETPAGRQARFVWAAETEAELANA